MNCPQCQASIDGQDASHFCSRCGARLDEARPEVHNEALLEAMAASDGKDPNQRQRVAQVLRESPVIVGWIKLSSGALVAAVFERLMVLFTSWELAKGMERLTLMPFSRVLELIADIQKMGVDVAAVTINPGATPHHFVTLQELSAQTVPDAPHEPRKPEDVHNDRLVAALNVAVNEPMEHDHPARLEVLEALQHSDLILPAHWVDGQLQTVLLQQDEHQALVAYTDAEALSRCDYPEVKKIVVLPWPAVEHKMAAMLGEGISLQALFLNPQGPRKYPITTFEVVHPDLGEIGRNSRITISMPPVRPPESFLTDLKGCLEGDNLEVYWFWMQVEDKQPHLGLAVDPPGQQETVGRLVQQLWDKHGMPGSFDVMPLMNDATGARIRKTGELLHRHEAHKRHGLLAMLFG